MLTGEDNLVMKFSYRNLVGAALALLAGLVMTGRTNALAQEKAAPRPLPSNQWLGQVPGQPAGTSSFSDTIALSPDGRYAVLLNDGYGSADSDFHQSLAVMDLKTRQVKDYPDARLSLETKQTYFLGLAFSPDGGELFASIASFTDPLARRKGDVGNGIAVYRFTDGVPTPERFLTIGPQPLAPGHVTNLPAEGMPAHTVAAYPAGLAVVPRGAGLALLVADNLADNVLLLDAATGQVLHRFDLADNAYVPGAFPTTVAVMPGGRYAYCSLWNASAVAKLDLATGKVVATVPLMRPLAAAASGSHPGAMRLSPDGKTLYVALANRDRVAVVNTATDRLEQTLLARLPGQAFGGSIPDALALDPQGRLYVAEAGLDAVAVFEPGAHGLVGPKAFIPTEWYPTALAVEQGGLLIATGKGKGTRPNGGPAPVQPPGSHRSYPYIAWLLHGSIARVTLAGLASQGPAWTREVLANNRIGATPAETGVGWKTPIKHVIYVIRENRTYDQILGDLSQNGKPVGDGDAGLAMFGATITPNAHRLALQFGDLDNFEVSAEVSAGGHVWSTAASTSDYTEQTWQINYRNGQRTYDYEGYVEGATPMERDLPDVDEPGTGYIWGDLARNHLSYRNYGEYIHTTFCSARGTHCQQRWIEPGQPLPAALSDPGGTRNPWPWRIPEIATTRATMPELVGHYDPAYADFRLDYPDQLRMDEFLNQFRGFVAARASGHGTAMPQFILLRLPDDHTAGTSVNMPTPQASVADNDLALGRLVQAVSHSPYWNDTAIFVVEDDAQNGPDHVDAHRSVAFVISKYSPASPSPYVDHNFYTTVNLIRTMEALLGAPPMNHNDATARVMKELFGGPGTQPPYTADTSAEQSGLIYRMNTRRSPDAALSATLDFADADEADPAVLNRIIWDATHAAAAGPSPQTRQP